jgi:uncharacterized protein YjiS (DUF1127 family)
MAGRDDETGHRRRAIADISRPDRVAMQQIAEWLKDLGMPKPKDAGRFAENRSDISVLPELTEQHLKDLGVARGDNAARDPRSRQRFGCREGALEARGDRANSPRRRRAPPAGGHAFAT